MNNIGIDGGAFDPRQDMVSSGIERMLEGFIRGLRNQKPQNTRIYYFYFGKRSSKRAHGPINYIRLPRILFAQVWLPLAAWFHGVAVFLGFSGMIPKSLPRSIRPIVFLYDLGFMKQPAGYRNAEGLISQTRYAASRAYKIVTLSEYAKQELVKKLQISAHHIEIIRPGIDHIYAALANRSPKRPPTKRYFLAVGVLKHTKNILKLLELYEKFGRKYRNKDIELMIVGPQETQYYWSIIQNPIYSRIAHRVSFVGSVSEKELYWYYRHAVAVLNTSYEEGFCFPVFEAQALGIPVIVFSHPVYLEYNKVLSDIFVCKNNKEFVTAMDVVSRFAHSSKKVKAPFRWSQFTSKVLQTL